MAEKKLNRSHDSRWPADALRLHQINLIYTEPSEMPFSARSSLRLTVVLPSLQRIRLL